MPRRGASRRRMRTQAEWKVDTHIARARGPTSVDHALAHLARGLVGEGDREDLAGPRVAGGEQVGDAPGQHPGLARPGARDDEQRRSRGARPPRAAAGLRSATRSSAAGPRRRAAGSGCRGRAGRGRRRGRSSPRQSRCGRRRGLAARSGRRVRRRRRRLRTRARTAIAPANDTCGDAMLRGAQRQEDHARGSHWPAAMNATAGTEPREPSVRVPDAAPPVGR